VSSGMVPSVLGYRGLSPDLPLRFNLPGWLGLVPGIGNGSHGMTSRCWSWCGSRPGWAQATPAVHWNTGCYKPVTADFWPSSRA